MRAGIEVRLLKHPWFSILLYISPDVGGVMLRVALHGVLSHFSHMVAKLVWTKRRGAWNLCCSFDTVEKHRAVAVPFGHVGIRLGEGGRAAARELHMR